MQRQMTGGEGGAGGDFPAPGVTDQTPGGAETGATPNAAANPFASLLGNMGAGGAGGANPLAALFGNMNGPGAGTTPATSPPAAASTGQGTPSANAQDPFANLFSGAQGGAGGSDPLAQMTRTMMENPEMMRGVMQMMTGNSAPPPAVGADGAVNPFSQLFNPAALQGLMGGAGAGGFGGMGAAQEPTDTRPPEERYESQLRQLNEMGFYEFDRNVAALRRSGGNVQGAIEHLLGGS